MKARTVVPVKIHVGNDTQGSPIFEEKEPGYILEHPDVYVHCVTQFANRPPRMVPADEECERACKLWHETTGKAGRYHLAFLAGTVKQGEANFELVVWLASQHNITKEEIDAAIAGDKATSNGTPNEVGGASER